MVTIGSTYLQTIFNHELFAKQAGRVIVRLEKLRKTNNFDAIAFRGISGAAMAFPVSCALKIPLICVRKGGTKYNEHGSFWKKCFVEGNLSAKKYIIIDDFIETGNTIRRIEREVSRFYLINKVMRPELVGVFLYENMKFIKNIEKYLANH